MKKRILIIVQDLAGGGAEHMAAETSKVFADDYDVMIVTFRPEIDFRYNGTYLCLYEAASGVLGKVFSALSRWRKIKRIKQDYKPNCSISFMPNANLVNVFTKDEELEVSSVRANPEYNVKKGSLRYRIRKATLLRSDIIVTPSVGISDVINRFYGLGNKDIRTIYNVCDTIQGNSKSDKCDQNCKYIYTIGRLSMEKGQWHIIKAFSIVHNIYPNVKLKVIGEGVMRESFKKLVYNLGIIEDVVFTGFLKNPVEELEYGNIFVLSSITESFSNVLIEAMSAGLACISADCNYGPREILNIRNDIPVKKRFDAMYGILVPSFKEKEPDYSLDINDDERLLADTICDLITNNQLRMHYCEMGRERAEFFSFERYRNEWRKLVEDVHEQIIQ